MKKVKYQCRQIDEDWCPSVEMPEPIEPKSKWRISHEEMMKFGKYKEISIPLVRRIYPQL